MTADLRERILSGSGPDRELDALIVAHQNNALLKRYPPTDDFGPRAKWQFWSEDGKHFLGNESRFPVPPLTASVGACIALMGEVLPGWGWLLANEGLVTRAELLPPYFSPTDNPNSIAATHEDLCRALLAAVLDAKAQEARND